MNRSHEAEIGQLYQAHGPAVLRYLSRSFGHGAAAEDMLHDTFFQAMRQPDRLRAAASPRAWLFGIARHVGLTHLRRQRPMNPLHSAMPALAHDDPNLAAMREAIEQLPIAQREPLELRLRDRLTYEEIAAVLEIPLGTVRSRLHAAMRQLAQTLEVDSQKDQSHGR